MKQFVFILALMLSLCAAAESYSPQLRARAEKGDAEAQYWVGMAYLNGDNVSRDMKQAFSWFQKSAEKGNVYSLENLGQFYIIGLISNPDPAKAAECYAHAVEGGNYSAAIALGSIYFYGMGVEKNLVKAFDLFTKASAKGYPLADYWLAQCYETGSGVPKNLSEAAYYYDRAILTGQDSQKNAQKEFMTRLQQDAATDAEAAEAYTVCLQNGWGVAKNPAEMVRYATIGADKGNPVCMQILGEAYLNGTGTTENIGKALPLLKKADAAGVRNATYLLGWMNETGTGMPVNFLEAVRYYRCAANQNHPLGCNNMAIMYMKGMGIGRDLYKAIYWFEKAAALGDSNAKENLKIFAEKYITKQRDNQERAIAGYIMLVAGQHEKGLKMMEKVAPKEPFAYGLLSSAYGSDAFIPKNYEKALRYATLGAEKGDVLSKNNLAAIYYNGYGVLVDYRKAAELWAATAATGDYEAAYNLGTMYMNGKGVEKNEAKAVELFTEASNAGYLPAVMTKGVFSCTGRGFSRDYNEGFRMLKQCVPFINSCTLQAKAQIAGCLADCYRNGHGTTADPVQTDYWQALASAGNVVASAEAPGRSAEPAGVAQGAMAGVSSGSNGAAVAIGIGICDVFDSFTQPAGAAM